MADGKYDADADAYRRQALSLLPQGPAWPLDDPASVLARFWGGVGEGMARHHARALDLLLRESLPPAALEMLSDWERVAGLPDDCVPPAASIDERRAVLASRMKARGDQSVPYFMSLAADAGYSVAVEERRPFRCGVSECAGTHEIAPDAIRHRWRVRVLEARLSRFRCGVSECGIHALTDIRRAEDLECVLRRVEPAHGILDFSYEGV